MKEQKYIDALRSIAEKYDREGNSYMFTAGICFALSCELPSDEAYRAYSNCNRILRRCQAGWSKGMQTVLEAYGSRKAWEPRANMCLLMAHWLEDELNE